VCISYATEDRDIAMRLARQLKRKYSMDVFFDGFEQHKLIGHQLTEMLYSIYARDSLLCVALFSNAYAEKDWTRHELRAARDRTARTRDRPYILPVMLDEGAVPADLKSISYWRYKAGTEGKLVQEIGTRYYEWVEQNMATLEEITEIVSQNSICDDILDGFREGTKEADDTEYIQAIWVLGLLAAVSGDELTKSVRALLDYIASLPSLVCHSDHCGRFEIFGSATVWRHFGHHGPLLFSMEGWQSFLGDRAETRRQYWENESKEDDTPKADTGIGEE
jgi:hypothetical protein